jgi:hypothetical protein
MRTRFSPLRIGVAFACVIAAGLSMARCGGSGTTAPSVPPTPTGPVGPTGPTGSTGTPITAILVGAGDIGYPGLNGAKLTGQLLSGIGGQVFTAGDNAYFNATAEEFRTNYDPYWGAQKARTLAVPGNHEYDPPGNPNNYYDYFGAAAGPRGLGYYSVPVGDWHVIWLNSAIPFGNGSAQMEWLKNDLAQNQNTSCTAAIWHHPLFSSGQNGGSRYTHDAWTWLYDAGVEIVINGHDHDYEVFAPQTPDGVADPNGIREFVVGTGGAVPYPFSAAQPNSQVRLTGAPNNNMFGVLKLTLTTGSYSWEFVTNNGVKDSGGPVQCHAPNVRTTALSPFTILRRR